MFIENLKIDWMQDCNQYILHKTTQLQHKGTNLWKHTTLYNSNCILVWERCYINIFSLHLADQSSHIASILCCHNIQSKIPPKITLPQQWIHLHNFDLSLALKNVNVPIFLSLFAIDAFMEVNQKMLHFALPLAQNFTSHAWHPLWFLFQPLLHSLKFLKPLLILPYLSLQTHITMWHPLHLPCHPLMLS